MTHQDNLAAVRAACLLARAPKGAVEATSNDYDPEIGHVLLALGKAGRYRAIDTRGDFMEHIGGQDWRHVNVGNEEVGDEGVFWEFSKPLSGQSEETISFLAALLKNND